MADKQMTEYFRFRMDRNCEAVIAIYGGPVTQEGIEMLQRTIDLMRDCFPNAEEPKLLSLDSSRPTTEAIGDAN